MSGPTKGSVAGQPIQTGTVTKEYEDGFERTFGERKAVRGRFLYTSGGKALEAPVRVDDEWTQPDTGPSHKSEEEVYGKVTATDGTDLSTRKRHAEYMKRNNLTIDADFKESWARAAKERDAVLSGTHEGERKEIRETVGRALYQQKRRK